MAYAWNIVAAIVILLVGLWLVSRITRGLNALLAKRMEPMLARFL
ncbi:mechanosensitive ion channel family protein, partial [Photobacterium sanguinicancri]